MNIEHARSIYEEIVDQAKECGIVSGEQDGNLPVANIENGHALGEVKMIRRAPDDYRVIWYPPESHVGQDLLTDRPVDESDALDVSQRPPAETVREILAFEPPDTQTH